MRSWTTRRLLCCCLTLGGFVLAPAPAEAAARPDVQGLADRVRGLVADVSPGSAAAIAELVRHGLPPAGLAVLLDEARAQPRVDLLPVLRELSTYRRPEIRARAFVARAQLGGIYADGAVSAAADDLELGVRRLAVVLGHANPSPTTERVVAELLANDSKLAAEFASEGGLVPEAGLPAPDFEPEPQEEEEPVPFSHVDPGTPEPIVPDSIEHGAVVGVDDPEPDPDPGASEGP